MGDQRIHSDQSTSDEEDAYMDELWSQNEEDYGHESYREELEPEPPDHVQHTSIYKKWYEEEEEWGAQEYRENDPIKETWAEEDTSQGVYEEDAGRGELIFKQPNATRSSTWSRSHKTSHTSKSIVHFNFAYHHSANEIQLYEFSGKRSYLEWERNMEDWFYYNCIRKEKRLAYAVDQLTGEAYKWWLQEKEICRFYKEPAITTWEHLKKLLRDQFVPKHKNKAHTSIKRPR